MRLEKVQDALRAKNIKYEYTEEDGCGSLDFMFRGLKFHVWVYWLILVVLWHLLLQPLI